MSHLLRYLLIYGERKKKVELSVNEDIENVKVETLKQKAQELFNLKNVLLQIWDKGFEDWVDLDEGDPTPNNSRIKVEIDKEAKNPVDTSTKWAPSSMPTSQSTVLFLPKVNAPVVQVLSTPLSSASIAKTTAEAPEGCPAVQKTVVPLVQVQEQGSAKPVASRQPLGMPQRAGAGQKRYSVEDSEWLPSSKHAVPSASRKYLKVDRDEEHSRDPRYPLESSRGATWSLMECQSLIGIWCSDEVQTTLFRTTTNRNKAIFQKIARRLSENGFQRRPYDRVRDKVNRMKAEHRKIRNMLKSGIPEEDINFPNWYGDVDRAFGSKLSVDLPDLVDGGNHDDLSSTMTMEDREDLEEQTSDDESGESGYREADLPSRRSPRQHRSAHHQATRGSVDGESGGDGGDEMDKEKDDAWIVQDIMDAGTEIEAGNDNSTATYAAENRCGRDVTKTGGEENTKEGVTDGDNDEGNDTNKIQVKLEMEDYN